MELNTFEGLRSQELQAIPQKMQVITCVGYVVRPAHCVIRSPDNQPTRKSFFV